MNSYVVAKYIRLSLDDAKSGSMSIEHQRMMLDEYISDMPEENASVIEFVDNGFSGTNFERPGVQELLEMVQTGKVNCIVVKDFSRFGRNAIETGYFIERVFPLYRVRFVSVGDGFDSAEHEGDTGGMEVAFKFLMHEYYSKDLSRKIRSAKQERARRGEAVTINCAFGYKLDENRNMVMDDEAAKTVRIIFEMYAAQKSIVAIEKRLYDEGRPTPAAWKKHRWKTASTKELRCVWQKSVILSILRDEQYIGFYIAGKTRTIEVANPNRARIDESDWVRIPGHHPAIVSRELFAAVQDQLQKKGDPLRSRKMGTAQRYAGTTSPLKGKVVCGHCNHTMRLSSTKNAAFHCWFTRSASDVACHKLRIQNDRLMAMVHSFICEQAKAILDADVIKQKVTTRIEHEQDYLEKIAGCETEKQALYERFIFGELSADEYQEKSATLAAEIAHLQQAHGTLIEGDMLSRESGRVLTLAKDAMNAGELTQAMVDAWIEKILIFPDGAIDMQWKAGLGNGAILRMA